MPKQYDDEQDDFQKRATIAKKETGQKKTFTLPEGETEFRLLRTPKGKGTPEVWMEFYMHYQIGPKHLSGRCGLDAKDDSGDCWLCNKLVKEEERGNTDLVDEQRRKKTLAVQAAIFDSDIGELIGPKLWAPAKGGNKSQYYKLIQILSHPKAGKYLDHQAGYNFTIDRTGLKMNNTTYGAPVRADEPSAVPKKILDKLRSFAEVLPQYDPEYLKSSFYGQDDEDDEKPEKISRRKVEEDEDELPKKRSRFEDEDEDQPVRKPVKASRDEDEDEEEDVKQQATEDEEEENLEYGKDDDEEVEVKSKAKRKVTREDPDEDEDEEKPVVKAKSKKVVDEDEDATEEDEEELAVPRRGRR